MLQLSAFARDAGFQIAWSIARRIGVIPRPGFELAFQAQVQREDGNRPDSLGVVDNNPLNLTAPNPTYWPGQTGFASGGSATEQHTDFAVFATLKDGVEAAAQNYLSPTYVGVQDAIGLGGDAATIAQAIASSPWDSGHYPGFVDQVQQLEAEAAAAALPPPSSAQEAYDLIAPILQTRLVAPQADTDTAIKEVLAQQAAAIRELASVAGRVDHVSDAALAEIITKIGAGIEMIGASVGAPAKGG